MKSKLLKTASATLFAAIMYFGVSFSSSTIKISGEQATVTLTTLGNQAKAYCNEANGNGEFNNGLCTGQFGDPTTRCLQPSDPTASPTCLK